MRVMSARAPVAELRDVSRHYTFHEQSAGLGGAVRAMLRREQLTRVAVDRVSFAIAPGEIVGLLGPNGAGKTTTLKMLCGLLPPSAGEVSVLGCTPGERRREFLARIAMVMGQKSMLWWDVPAMDSFLVHKEIYSISQARFTAAVEELSQLLQIGALLRKAVRKLSLGERMKCELALALLHDPELVFLDEPTIGLDVVSKLAVREFLADLNRRRGTTVVVTSHDMDDIASLCPRVIVMTGGRLEFDGPLAGLIGSVSPGKTVRVTYRDRVPALPPLPAGVSAAPGGSSHQLIVRAPDEQIGTVTGLVAALGPIADIEIRDADPDLAMRAFFLASAGRQP